MSGEFTFPHLLAPLTIRNVTLRNRIVSTAHDTMLAVEGLPSDRLVAYQESRAAGGAGLIITEVAAVHATARYTSHIMMATDDECIPGFTKIAAACHRHGCMVFGQLFHPGREIFPQTEDGTARVAYSASAVPNERFHVVPRPMSAALIREVVAGYADGAGRLQSAGYDGVEILASHGYLISQFLNPRVNWREDEYGGSDENRLRLLCEVLAAVRHRIGDMVIGLRISGKEHNPEGLRLNEVVDICRAQDQHVDYFSINAGSSTTVGSSIFIVPPMEIETAHVVPYAAAVRSKVSKPVLVAGRIHRPEMAEKILASREADLCGMTRSMISDPELANKIRAGRIDDIRTCIACNQACIGHMHMGAPISCIQYPESGRELEYESRARNGCYRAENNSVDQAQEQPSSRVMVVGGGPAGMKAAAVAAERGHDVTLYERSLELGGQVRLAAKLPGRAEFGGLTKNLTREMELAGVRVVTATEVTLELVRAESPEIVILATGARPRRPTIPGEGRIDIVTAWEVLGGEAVVGDSVVVADWRCDWIGLGVAEKLAREGRRVRLCVNGNMAGQSIQQYVRDQMLGNAHRVGVEIIPMVRLGSLEASVVRFQHTTSGQPVMCHEVDTLVLSLDHEAVGGLEEALSAPGAGGLPIRRDDSGPVVSGASARKILAIGDCVCPRTAEEAVLEGLNAGLQA